MLNKNFDFEEIAKLFTNCDFRFSFVMVRKIETVFQFYVEQSKFCFSISTFDEKNGYSKRYSKQEQEAYEILRENGYVG